MGFSKKKKLPAKIRKDLKVLYKDPSYRYKRSCALCPYNKLKNTKTLPSGAENPEIYILSEHPLSQEDMGQFKDVFEAYSIRFGSIQHCYSFLSDVGSTKSAKQAILDCCKSNVEQDIERSKPSVILGCGPEVLNYFLDERTIQQWRGRRIAQRVGAHDCWLVPVYDFDFLEEKAYGEGKLSPYDKVYIHDLDYVAKIINLREKPEVISSGYTDGIEIFLGKNHQEYLKVKKFLELMRKVPSIGLDIETTELRPFGDTAVMLTVAIGTKDDVLAFPLDHPQGWGVKVRPEILQLVYDFLLESKVKVAHNLKFESQWFREYFGNTILYNTDWADTMAQRYIIDERHGTIQSLNSMVRQYFGFDLKSLSNIDRKKIINEPLDKVLLYNGLDTKFTHKSYLHQETMIPYGCRGVYDHSINSIIAVTEATAKGMHVSKRKLACLGVKYKLQINKLQKSISSLSEVKELEKQQGKPFNSGSPTQLVKIFRDILKIKKKAETPKGGYSTSKDVLPLFAEDGVGLAQHILELRKYMRAKKIYIDNLTALTFKEWVHPEYNVLKASTGRLSSGKDEQTADLSGGDVTSNFQNFNKRGQFKEVRDIIDAPQGYGIFAFDYGQIEARVLAMIAKDRAFCEEIRNDFEIHGYWAAYIAQRYIEATGAATFEEYMSTPELKKNWRDKIKNGWVFPQFYGSSVSSCAESLAVPESILEDVAKTFWDRYEMIRQWQFDLYSFFNKHNYIQTPLGRRRHGPMRWTEVINAPIQGTASDIVTNAMYRIGKFAFETDQPDLAPRMNIHDDLTFLLRRDHTLDDNIKLIAKMMCQVPYSFVNVPVSVEVEQGQSWGKLEKLAVFKTTDFENVA